MNIPESILSWGWAGVMALVGYIWKSQDEKIASTKTALQYDLHTVDSRLSNRIEAVETAANDEMKMQRGNIAKLFDKLEEHARRSEDRHHELLTAIHVGLAGKQDK